MIFLGRDRETAKIISCLKRGENVVLTGRYGIGRTSLVKKTASLLLADWKFIFADFSKTPGETARNIAFELIKQDQKKSSLSSKRAGSLLKYGALIDKRHPVIVLDNIASMTGHKISFLQELTFQKRFSLIAITESFLPQQSLFRLRSCLFPAQIMKLGYMRRKDVIEFFRVYSEKYGLNWDASRLNTLISLVRGYPLSIKEIITREIERQKRPADP